MNDLFKIASQGWFTVQRIQLMDGDYSNQKMFEILKYKTEVQKQTKIQKTVVDLLPLEY